MNCKQGDLAVKIKADSGDYIPIGAVVRCIQFTEGVCEVTGKEVIGWIVEFRGSNQYQSGAYWVVVDEYLRPIRDEDGEDEMLTLVGKPSTIEQDKFETV